MGRGAVHVLVFLAALAFAEGTQTSTPANRTTELKTVRPIYQLPPAMAFFVPTSSPRTYPASTLAPQAPSTTDPVSNTQPHLPTDHPTDHSTNHPTDHPTDHPTNHLKDHPTNRSIGLSPTTSDSSSTTEKVVVVSVIAAACVTVAGGFLISRRYHQGRLTNQAERSALLATTTTDEPLDHTPAPEAECDSPPESQTRLPELHSSPATENQEVRCLRRSNMIASCEYVAGDLLGRGAAGSVFAYHLLDGSTVAMKEVNLFGSKDEVQAQMRDITREVNLLRPLQHPNVVEFYGSTLDTAKLQLHLFMEYVSLGSVGALVRQMDGPLNVKTARGYTRHIVRGLAYLHETGLIHRDLKCDNLLLDSDGVVKLADFGTARMAGTRTTMMTMVGTPLYMAPEILLCGPNGANGYSKLADIWSLGITIAEMCDEGRAPWPSFTSAGHALMYISSEHGIPSVDKLHPLCADFVRSCCQRNPRDRPTAAQLLEHPWIAGSRAPIRLRRVASKPTEPPLRVAASSPPSSFTRPAVAA